MVNLPDVPGQRGGVVAAQPAGLGHGPDRRHRGHPGHHARGPARLQRAHPEPRARRRGVAVAAVDGRHGERVHGHERPITIQEDSAASLTLTVSGAPLSLTCTAYPNDTVTPSGITTSTPSASPIAPVIAVAGGGSTSTTAPPATTTTTKAPAGGGGGTTTPNVVTAPSTKLAFTGVGPGIGVLGVLGGALILLGFALLVLVDAPRRAMSRLVFLGPSTLRRVRAGDMAERLAILNPMRWKRTRNEGVPDTTMTPPAQPDGGELEGVSPPPGYGGWATGSPGFLMPVARSRRPRRDTLSGPRSGSWGVDAPLTTEHADNAAPFTGAALSRPGSFPGDVFPMGVAYR